MDVRRQGSTNDNGMGELPVASQQRSTSGGKSSGLLSKIVAVLLVIVLVLVVGWFINRVFTTLSTNGAVKGKQYQAVFLTNGQVYFGKLSKASGNYVTLTDIYYLQVQQTVQPKDSTANNNQQVSLAKLGGELHGPEDVMHINNDQVLFWENLKSDGKVTKAISDYKAGNK